MTELQRLALASEVLDAKTVEDIFDVHSARSHAGLRPSLTEQYVRALCESHERLRFELAGAEAFVAALPGGTERDRPTAVRVAAEQCAVLLAHADSRVEQAEEEKGALQVRIDNAVAELDALADLLAESQELPVGQTHAVRVLNEVLEALAGVPRNKGG